jgi:hypothetical protein
MINLVENQTYDPTISVPQDGIDFRTAATLYPALQSLANRTKHLHDLLLGALSAPETVVLQLDLIVQGPIAAAGASFSRNVEVDATLIADTLLVTGSSTFSATTTLNGDVTVAGATNLNGATAAQALQSTSFACHGSSQLGDTNLHACTVNATTTFTAPIFTNSSLRTVGPLTVFGGATLASVASCTGTGRVVRPAVIGSQSGSTTVITPATATTYHFPVTTADQNFNLPASPTEGDEVEVSSSGAGFYVNVRTPAGATIRSLKFASGEVRYVKVKVISGVWTELFYSAVP